MKSRANNTEQHSWSHTVLSVPVLNPGHSSDFVVFGELSCSFIYFFHVLFHPLIYRFGLVNRFAWARKSYCLFLAKQMPENLIIFCVPSKVVLYIYRRTYEIQSQGAYPAPTTPSKYLLLLLVFRDCFFQIKYLKISLSRFIFILRFI